MSSNNFEDYVSDDYDEFNEMQILAEAQARGISFEQAYDMIVHGNTDFNNVPQGGNGNYNNNNNNYYDNYTEDAPPIFYDADGNAIQWTQEEFEAFQGFENGLNKSDQTSSSPNFNSESFPPLSSRNITSTNPAPVKTKLKSSSNSFVPLNTNAAPFVPGGGIAPTVSSSGGKASYTTVNPKLDFDNLNLKAVDCLFYFGSGCTRGLTCKNRHAMRARYATSICPDFASRRPCNNNFCDQRHVSDKHLVEKDSFNKKSPMSMQSNLSHSPENVPFSEWAEWAEAADELGSDGSETTWDAILLKNNNEILLHARARKDFENRLLTGMAVNRFSQVDDLRLQKWMNIQKAFVKKYNLRILPQIPGTW